MDNLNGQLEEQGQQSAAERELIGEQGEQIARLQNELDATSKKVLAAQVHNQQLLTLIK